VRLVRDGDQPLQRRRAALQLQPAGPLTVQMFSDFSDLPLRNVTPAAAAAASAAGAAAAAIAASYHLGAQAHHADKVHHR